MVNEVGWLEAFLGLAMQLTNPSRQGAGEMWPNPEGANGC